MADKQDETKGTVRAGGNDGKRPHATIDLKAQEVKDEAFVGGGPENKRDTSASEANSGAWHVFGVGLPAWLAASSRSAATHALAGALGGAIVLILAWLVPWSTSTAPPPAGAALQDLSNRLTDLEAIVGPRQGPGALRAAVDGLARSNRDISETQDKLATELGALKNRIENAGGLPQDVASRLAKLEEALATQQATGAPGNGEEARANVERFDRELASLKRETGQLGQAARAVQSSLDSLRTQVDQSLKTVPKAADVTELSSKLAALENEFQAFAKSESNRDANASRVVLSLELASLKRAIDRGAGYAAELAAVKETAGGTIDLKPLERYMSEGVPTLSELTRSFRKTANAMIDAEAEGSEGSLLQRLLSGARSFVRVRRAGNRPDDASVEGIVGRMEAALKEGHLAEVLAQAKSLPPSAALAGEEWIKALEARYTVDKALSDTESALKKTLAERPAPADARR
jgi:hypothetical protein